MQSRAVTYNFNIHVGKTYLQQQGKMNLHLIFIVIVLTLTCMCKHIAIDTMPELKKNILNFGYRVNFILFIYIVLYLL